MPIITGSPSSESEAYYQSVIAGKWGTAAGTAYAGYAAAHPSLTPLQAADDFTEIILVEGLDSAIAAGVNAGTAVDIGGVAAAAKGGENAVADLSPAQWLDKLGGIFTSRGTWIRIAEGVLGIAVILVAVAELGKGTAVGNAVKKVPFI
jgi:hypothetical protein